MPWIAIYGDKIGSIIVFWLLFLLFIVFGWFSGLGEGTVFVMVGMMPSKYMGAIILGRGISGLFSNLLSLASLKQFHHTDDFVSITFFTISAGGALLASTFYTLVLKKSECFRFYLQDVRDSIDMAKSGRFCEQNLVTESAAQDIKVHKPRDVFAAIKRQFRNTNGLLYAVIINFTMTYSIFPVVLLTPKLKLISCRSSS